MLSPYSAFTAPLRREGGGRSGPLGSRRPSAQEGQHLVQDGTVGLIILLARSRKAFLTCRGEHAALRQLQTHPNTSTGLSVWQPLPPLSLTTLHLPMLLSAGPQTGIQSPRNPWQPSPLGPCLLYVTSTQNILSPLSPSFSSLPFPHSFLYWCHLLLEGPSDLPGWAP